MVETSNNTSMSKARREPQRGPGNHRGALSQPHSVCAEIKTPKASRGKKRGGGCPHHPTGVLEAPPVGSGAEFRPIIDFIYILGRKEAIFNTFFNIFERWRGPQNVAGPGKTPPSLRAWV